MYRHLWVIIALNLLFTQPARAQVSAQRPLWEGLDPGPHLVGFRSFWRRDRTRTFTMAVDQDGKRLPVDPARPVRINMWYPAQSGGRATTIASYLDPARTPGFEAEESFIRDVDVGDGKGPGFRRIVALQSLYDALLSTPTAAHQDARVQPGHHPVVVYALGQGDYTQEDIPFCEYLASRGFIVVSVPQLGTSPRRSVMFIHDAASYDVQVSDLAFGLATVLREFPEADPSRVGAIGMSMGGVYATLLALRNSAVRVVIGRDPSIIARPAPYFYKYWETPAFEPARFRGHMLIMYKQDPLPREKIVDSLRFASRTLIRMPYVVHTDFTGYPQYSRTWPLTAIDSFALAQRTPEQAVTMYTAATRYVGCYLDAILMRGQQDPKCKPIPGGEVEYLPASAGPSEEELYTVMRLQGLDRAAEIATKPQRADLRRPVMLRIANELGYAGRTREEAEYAELITVMFPDAESYEHAGDNWAEVGEAARARSAYEQALSLEPSRKGVREKIAKLR
ncbi:MAG: hypothetical protein ABI556_14055 [Gemmatimonadales bacterium]